MKPGIKNNVSATGFFLFLAVMAGIIILWPLRDFQYYLAQGDHGRDLYCFKKTLEGGLPYRDYSWLFGPLLPYYYSAFFRLWGVGIQSALAGYLLLVLLAGILVFLIAALVMPPAAAFIVSLWYWAFRGLEFFYTYNHAGGLVMLLGSLYYALRYAQDRRPGHIYAGIAGLFLLMLIRFNMGVASLAAFVSAIFIVERVFPSPSLLPRGERVAARILIPATLSVIAAAGIYAWLLHPLPGYVIGQTFPYGQNYRVDVVTSPWAAFTLMIQFAYLYATATIPRLIFTALVCFSAGHVLFRLLRREIPKAKAVRLLLAFSVIGLYLLFALHEFLTSGVFYRLAWVFPLWLIAIFWVLELAVEKFPAVLKRLFWATLLAVALVSIGIENYRINLFKIPATLFNVGNNRVYLLQQPQWKETVTNVTNYIVRNVPPGEKIFAVPFDPIYYYLTGRDSASRQLIFFAHNKIPAEQEQAVIADLERNKVNFVLVSNRLNGNVEGLGVFGKDCCQALAQHIWDNYQPVLGFGNWDVPPGWAWNHAVVVLKRTTPFRTGPAKDNQDLKMK